jgi:NAD(P)-dependent dehydrogenase (short-subunit alcohol dehydrogenase family)
MGALAGKVAIVTGGTSGIGGGIAARFVEEGAKVVVAVRRQDEGAALEKRLGARFVRTDVANEADQGTSAPGIRFYPIDMNRTRLMVRPLSLARS